MSNKTAAGIVLLVCGAAAAVWGTATMPHAGSQINETTNIIAQVAGAIIAFVGLIVIFSPKPK